MPAPISNLLWILAREPYNIPPPVAARMSYDQISLILRTPEEVEELTAEPPSFDVRRVHYEWAALNCLPDWYADKLWRESGGG